MSRSRQNISVANCNVVLISFGSPTTTRPPTQRLSRSARSHSPPNHCRCPISRRRVNPACLHRHHHPLEIKIVNQIKIVNPNQRQSKSTFVQRKHLSKAKQIICVNHVTANADHSPPPPPPPLLPSSFPSGSDASTVLNGLTVPSSSSSPKSIMMVLFRDVVLSSRAKSRNMSVLDFYWLNGYIQHVKSLEP